MHKDDSDLAGRRVYLEQLAVAALGNEWDYSGIMQSADIEDLHNKCVGRLKDLIAQANRTCSLLELMTEFPITLDIWQKAIDQRLREDDAQTQYQEARERLFDAIRPPQQR